MSWYARTGPRKKTSDKFLSTARVGVKQDTTQEYRGWTYQLVTHKTGSSVRRTLYCASICDSHGNRVEYLRDFSSLSQAEQAAQSRIDTLAQFDLDRSVPKSIGGIPTLPTQVTAQEK